MIKRFRYAAGQVARKIQHRPGEIVLDAVTAGAAAGLAVPVGSAGSTREAPAEGFLRHRGLIAFSAGCAIAEVAVLTVLAPAARSLALQVTAPPPLAVFHDLRWLSATTGRGLSSWPARSSCWQAGPP